MTTYMEERKALLLQLQNEEIDIVTWIFKNRSAWGRLQTLILARALE